MGGCSKRPFSKAAGESKPEAYPLGTLRISMNRERSWRAFSAASYFGRRDVCLFTTQTPARIST
ncbi:MAG TPA: hypothetical protein VE177_05760, partial [Candidatus Binatus sp.]|nr:hypothetical protein [Candidatus Binatus sp.]